MDGKVGNLMNHSRVRLEYELKRILMMQCYVCDMPMYVWVVREYANARLANYAKYDWALQGDNFLGVSMMIGLGTCLGRVQLTSRHWSLDLLMSKLRNFISELSLGDCMALRC